MSARTGERRAPIDPRHAIVLSLVSACASAVVLILLGAELAGRRPDGEPAGDLGQWLQASGIEGGPSEAQRTLASWETWDAVNDPILSATTIAYGWLVIDIIFLALLGYGLLSVVVLLLSTSRYPGWHLVSAEQGRDVHHHLFAIAGAFGVVLLVVDIVENSLAATVIATNGGGAVAALPALGRAKWAVAGIALLFTLVATAVVVARQLRHEIVPGSSSDVLRSDAG